MDKVLHCSARVPCNPLRAFEMFTVDSLLGEWLSVEATVEPVVGGKYELFWDTVVREFNSTIGCRVTAVERNKLIAFEWKGPRQFHHFMNEADPLTHVSVFFLPFVDGSDSGTEVHVIHSGWRNSEEWEDARSYFSGAWRNALESLKRRVSEDKPASNSPNRA